MVEEQKRIMFLGGISYIIPAIMAAHKMGCYVITADYLPDNPAHKYADKYVNVSIIDKEKVLTIAKEEKIDGIISFAVDPGVVTASYVAEQMGLPNVGPYKSVEILQNKVLFRNFLKENNFNVPEAKGYDSIEAALEDVDWINFPIIVKPADGSGSKGVTKVDCLEDYKEALSIAYSKSISKKIVVEEFIELDGFQSGSDSFSVDGDLVFASFDDQHFDANASNPYTPSAHTWPSTMSMNNQKFLQSELQRLISLLEMKTSLYNIEVRVGRNGKPYIMEVSPRAGGNRLSELLTLATGTDLVTASVQSALGIPVKINKVNYDGFWAVVVLHSYKKGKFKNLFIDKSIQSNVIKQNMNVAVGDEILNFDCATNSVGSLFMKFASKAEMDSFFANQNKLIAVEVE